MMSLFVLVTFPSPAQAGLDSTYPVGLVVFIPTVRMLRWVNTEELASFHSKKITQHLCLLSHCCDFQ